MLDYWAKVFGEEKIFPRLYTPSDMLGGDVATDFCALLGIDASKLLASAQRDNAGLSHLGQEFLYQFILACEQASPAMPKDGVRAACRRISERLESLFPGPGSMPTRGDAERFLAAFEESNERVRSRWFADRNVLFERDFHAYPADQSETAIPKEDLLNAAFRISYEVFK
jgi:hypothetical protein